MAETVAEIAGLLKLGPDAPLQPPRFAKVVSVVGDTVTVTLGGSNVDAVRCCACAADDVVLLETMPSGQLAAVATKGASGGGGGHPCTFWCVCESAANLQIKTATCSDPNFALVTGGLYVVSFKYGNSNAVSPRLNINNTGDKQFVLYDVGVAPKVPYAYVATFVYDGTYYRMVSNNAYTWTGNKVSLTSMNDATYGGASMHKLVTDTVTTGKPDWNGHIFQLGWPNKAWDAQIFIPYLEAGDSANASHKTPQWRACANDDASGWSQWYKFYTEAYPPPVGGCTEDSGGDTKEDVLAGTDTGQWHNGWREEKFDDGRLTKWKWQRFTATSGFNSLSMGITDGTAFSARPDVSVTIGPLMNSSYSPLTGYYVQGGISNFTNNTTVVIGAQAGLAGQLFCEVRMDGHWR